MRLDRGRKIFAAGFCLTVALLTWDRLVLGKAASAGADPSPQLLSAGTEGPRRVWLSESAARELGGTKAVNRLLDEASQRRRGAPQVAAVASMAAVDPHADLRAFSKRKLTSVMNGGRGGASVMIDGQILYLGQQIDGFRLCEVNHGSAWFQTRDARIRLSIAGAPRAEWTGGVTALSPED